MVISGVFYSGRFMALNPIKPFKTHAGHLVVSWAVLLLALVPMCVFTAAYSRMEYLLSDSL